MVVQFTEEGYWEMPMYSRNPDDEEWIGTGWQVVTFDGDVLFRHKEEQPVRDWLEKEGWQPVGDGLHFQKA